MLRVSEGIPSTPYFELPSASPSRGSARPQITYTSAISSVNSSTAALIQADIYCVSGRGTGWSSASNLFRFRALSAAWLLAAAIWIPLCEYQGGSCALGIDRDPALGEQGNLSGEGEPNPDGSITPESANTRTLWLIASLSYVLSCSLCFYFVYHLYLAWSNRLLFAQCCSYDYSALTIITHSSTSAHPLTWSQKLAGLMFQLFIPTSLGMCCIYFVFILPYRRPLSWFISLHLHLFLGIISLLELLWCKLIFRPKALVYWFMIAMAYCLLLLIVQIRGSRWEYSSLNPDVSLSVALVSWIFGVLFLGPGAFLACALAQYARDGWTRGVLTSAVDIGEAQASATSQLEQASVLHSRGQYIQGALARIARDAPPHTPSQQQQQQDRRSSIHRSRANSVARQLHPSLNDPSIGSPSMLSEHSVDVESSQPQQQARTFFGSVAGRSVGWLKSWWIAQP